MTVGDQRLIFFRDPEFSDFRSWCWDEKETGRTTQLGGGATLGKDSRWPQALLNTIMYMDCTSLSVVEKSTVNSAMIHAKFSWWKSQESLSNLQRGHFQESSWRFEGSQTQAEGGSTSCKHWESQPMLCATFQDVLRPMSSWSSSKCTLSGTVEESHCTLLVLSLSCGT